jgi:hypothetical protein
VLYIKKYSTSKKYSTVQYSTVLVSKQIKKQAGRQAEQSRQQAAMNIIYLYIIN